MTSTAAEYPEVSYMRYEKIGKYYFWTKQDPSSGGLTLNCAASASSKAKMLYSVKNHEYLSRFIVTDGKQVYYAVNKYDNEDVEVMKGSIYKISISGKKSKIKTVSYGVEPYAYYNGKLYYGISNSTNDLYVYDTAKKTTKKLKKDFFGESGYGKYITYRKDNNKQYIYNVTTGKSRVLPGESTIVSGKNIYYYTYSAKGVTVKKCDLSGKHPKTIKKLTGDYQVTYLGRTVVYFRSYEKKQDLKLAYKTKKLIKVK